MKAMTYRIRERDGSESIATVPCSEKEKAESRWTRLGIKFWYLETVETEPENERETEIEPETTTPEPEPTPPPKKSIWDRIRGK